MRARLAALGFRDTAAAQEQAHRLALDGDDDGAMVLAALAGTADPDLALRTLLRLSQRCAHPGDLASALRWHTGLRDRLLPVLGASQALGEHLVRHPEDWSMLADDTVENARASALGLRRLMLAAVGADPSEPLPWGSGGATARDASSTTLDALRLAYHRQLLGLAARDLEGDMPVEDVACELADLAAAALDAALAVAAAELPADSEPVRLAVIGMGKCGGRELNYRSDVDVVFVAEPLPGGNETAALATANRLAAGLIRVCSATTSEGDLFPVDAALRPEGRAGALTRTLASHHAYYSRWALAWELQALIKARPIAGDLALGREHVEALAPLVWSAAARPDLPAQVQQMRRRVERTLPVASASREIKLGPGGLRDIEFAVQLLQLVHGRADPTLRSGTTLSALEALADGGYVGRADAPPLAEAYRFLRLVEHRLQVQRLRRTHTVPAEGDPDRAWLARSVGFRVDALDTFDRELRRHGAVVRRLHEKLFYRPLLTATARLPAGLTPVAAADRLQALGFTETRQALAHIAALTAGVSRRAAIQRTLLPVLLGWFAETADPDAGLLAFRRLSDSLGETPWYLRSLRDEGKVAERLARLLSESRYVADLIGRAPEAMLLLADDAALQPRGGERLRAELLSVVRRTEIWEGGVAAARSLRRLELLRIASADLLGLIPLQQVQVALSDLAGATVAAALDTAQRKVEVEHRGPLPMKIAVIAMGRLGSAELGYGSDADVLFVHETSSGHTDEAAAAAAHAVAEETRRLLALPAPDPPLRLDAGLRPEGQGGALTVSLATFARYHATRGQMWERQALLRAAPLAGDDRLASRFLALVDPLRYPVFFSETEADEVRRMHRRVQTERVAPGLAPGQRWRDVKIGPGGLVDIEWATQTLQLRHAAEVPALQVPGTRTALLAARAAGLLTPTEAATLIGGHDAASLLRNSIVLVTGKASTVLPPAGRDADTLRRLAGPEIADSAETRAAEVRSVVERILSGKRNYTG